MTSLSTRALLVSLNISSWTARKLDRSETAAVALKHGTQSNVARVNKSLLPMADSLEAIHKLTTVIRADYYKATLPWRDGAQIITTDGYLDFVNKVSAQKLEWENAVRDFIRDYPQLREDAKALLNTLYRDEDYPDTAQVAAKFRMDVSFFPVPEASDWRVELGDEHVETLRKQIEDDVSNHLGVAMRAAWSRIYDVVSKAHERLKQPDAVFRNSLVDNAIELCHLLPSLNITKDPELETMRLKLERSLCANTADDLRLVPAIRKNVSDEMAEIMAKMAGFYHVAA